MKKTHKTGAEKWVRGLYYGAMPVFLAAGLYSGLRLWYFLFFIQLFTVLLILAADLWTVYTFRFTQTLSAGEAGKGELARINLSIINEKPFPLSMMEIRMETVCPDDRTVLRMSLAPFGSCSFTVPMTLPYRGVYEVGMTKITITDFFGLLPFTFDMRLLPYYRLPKITVFPRAELPEGSPGIPRDSKNLSLGRTRFSDSGEAPMGAREYMPGDPMRRVHWVKTAQLGKLYTREYESPRRESVCILLDNCILDKDTETGRIRMDTLCETAADLSLMGVTAGHPVHVLCVSALPGHDSEAEAENLRTFPKIHRMLAEAGVDDTDDAGEKLVRALETLPEGENGYLYLLTGNATRELAQTLTELEGRFSGVTLLQCGDSPVYLTGVHSHWIEPGGNVRAELEAM